MAMSGKPQICGTLGPPKSCEWATPQKLYDELHREFAFTLDACASAENAKCEDYFTKYDDGLVQDWGTGRVFMNPPYGRETIRWMSKAWESSQKGALVVCLVMARTDTEWFHRYALKGEVRFLRGRIRFSGAKWNAPCGSAVVIFRPPGTEETPATGAGVSQ